MSMSEFEGGFQDLEQNSLELSIDKEEFPTDFSSEDISFALALDALLIPEQEEAPPLFAQTLLIAEDERLQSVEQGFEYKTRAHVFRRLKLKRYLYSASSLSTHSVANVLQRSHVLRTFVATCFLFVLMTIVLAAPSFASGLRYLWAGAHSGVVEVDNASVTVSHAHRAKEALGDVAAQPSLTFAEMRNSLHFPLFWPQYVPEHYSQSTTYLYSDDQSWADGPLVVLNYTSSHSDGSSRQISICEFKPRGKVLQVVQNGAAQQIHIGVDNAASGVYVEGEWKQKDASSSQWIHTDRSELIYEDEESGVVFWIVGDKRDKINDDQLSKIARSLTPFDVNLLHMELHLSRVMQGEDNNSWPFNNNVIYQYDSDHTNDAEWPIFKVLGLNTSSTHIS